MYPRDRAWALKLLQGSPQPVLGNRGGLESPLPQGGTWPSWWNAAKPTSADWWVRGHLLNEHLGGPGEKKNLTPITKRCNNRHKTVVENLVKQAMKTHKMLAYYVDTSYGRGPTLAEDRVKNPDKSVWPKLTDGIYCHWEFIDENGKVVVKDQTVIENEQS